MKSEVYDLDQGQHVQEASVTVQVGFDKGLAVCGQQVRYQSFCALKSPQIPLFVMIIKNGPGLRSLQRKETGEIASGHGFCFAAFGGCQTTK